MPVKSEQTKVGQTIGDEHVLLKVRSEAGQTISVHADMIAKKGSAMLGKMGRGVGAEFRDVFP